MGVTSSHAASARLTRRGTQRSFFLYVFGCFLVYSAYGALLNLQSSINIVDGLGVATVATTYSVAVLFCLTFSPMIIRRFGPRKSLCVAECSHLVYILANAHATFYTMIPASLLLGIGDSLFWNCAPLMNAFFAKLYANAVHEDRRGPRKNIDERHYVTSFSGYFFAIFQCNKIFGNMVSYFALYAFRRDPSGNSTVETLRNTTFETTTNPPHDSVQYQMCGANDCQDEEVVGGNFSQYRPPDEALFVLMLILFCMCLGAILLHIFFVPDPKAVAAGIVDGVQNPSEVTGRTPEGEDGGDLPWCTCIPSRDDGGVSGTTQAIEVNNNRLDFEIKDELWNSDSESVTITKSEAPITKGLKINPKDGSRSPPFELCRQICNAKQIFFMPLILYSGLHLGFVYSEMTRAFSSCVVGVSLVPLHMMTYGAGTVFVSYMVGKFTKHIGVVAFLLAAGVIDVACYAYGAMWSPSLQTSWSLFLAYFAFGISQGIWVSQTAVMQVIHFSKRPEVACGLWSALFSAGISLQFGLSTSICLLQKIFIHLGILAAGVLSYGMARRTGTKE